MRKPEANSRDWEKIAKRLARAIVRYDRYPFAGGMSELAIMLANSMVKCDPIDIYKKKKK